MSWRGQICGVCGYRSTDPRHKKMGHPYRSVEAVKATLKAMSSLPPGALPTVATRGEFAEVRWSWRDKLRAKLFPVNLCALPEPKDFRPLDVITTRTAVRFDWKDRLRLLLSPRAIVEVRVATEHTIGKTLATAATTVMWRFPGEASWLRRRRHRRQLRRLKHGEAKNQQAAQQTRAPEGSNGDSERSPQVGDQPTA